MDLHNAIILRRSTRGGFQSDPIPEADLLGLIQAATFAPSAGNAQDTRFLILTDPADIAYLGEARPCWPYQSRSPAGGILARARALILVLSDTDIWEAARPRGHPAAWAHLPAQNAAAAIQNILLTATAKGLASCWVSASPEMDGTPILRGKTWAEILSRWGISERYQPYGIVMIGRHARPYHGEKIHGRGNRQVARRPAEAYVLEVIS